MIDSAPNDTKFISLLKTCQLFVINKRELLSLRSLCAVVWCGEPPVTFGLHYFWAMWTEVSRQSICLRSKFYWNCSLRLRPWPIQTEPFGRDSNTIASLVPLLFYSECQYTSAPVDAEFDLPLQRAQFLIYVLREWCNMFLFSTVRLVLTI